MLPRTVLNFLERQVFEVVLSFYQDYGCLLDAQTNKTAAVN